MSCPVPDERTLWTSQRRRDGDLAFPAMPESVVELLRSVGEQLHPRAGEMLWDAGDPYDLHLVLAGDVSLVDRREGRVVFVVEANDFVGELGMLMGQRAFLSGVAGERTTVLRVRVSELRRLVAISGELGDLILAALDARRRLLTEMGAGGLVLAGDEGARDLHRLEEFAERNQIPYRTVLRSDPSAWTELAAVSELPSSGAAVVTGDRRVLAAPTTRDLATALGIDVGIVDPGSHCSVLVIGAGPSGLAASVYAASEGLDVVVVEDVAIGGQAGSSSRIENYLGFPAGVSGVELARSGMLQAVKFGARLLSPRAVTEITRHPDGGFEVRLDDEMSVFATVVIVASGVRYRRLPLRGLTNLEGRGVYYAASQLEATIVAGRDAVVVGGANSAGQAALFLAEHANHVHILIRRHDLQDTMSSYLEERITHHERITVHPRSELSSVHGADRLTAATWRDHASGTDVHLEVAGVFLLIGSAPCTTVLPGAGVELDEKGFVITGDDFSTSVPGLYAVGDVRAGSVKRVASAVGEGSVVITSVHAYLNRLDSDSLRAQPPRART